MGTARPRPGHGCEFDTCRLQMIGGFNAFEMLPPDNDGDWQPGPEEKWLVDAKIEADNDNKAAEKGGSQKQGFARLSMYDLQPPFCQG